MPKPRRGQSVAVDVAGAEAAIQGHAQQAIATETMPGRDASSDDWATYCNAARGRAAAAVIEWGKRISMAHIAYKAQPQRWGRTWDDWCQQNLGIGKRHADRLQVIGQNLGLAKSHILPATTDQLHALARLKQQAPAVFEAAMASGTITPQMTRHEAQGLLKAATSTQALPASTEDVRPTFTRWHSMTLATDALQRLQDAAEAQGRKPEDLAAELLEKAIARLQN